MSIPQLAEEYLSEREASPHYRWFLRRIASLLHDAGLATAGDFTPCSINAWLGALRGDLSATTRGNYRRGALVLWHYASSRGLADHPNGRVKRVKQSRKAPVAWSMDELAGLLDRCRSLDGHLRNSGCPAKLFWTAWVLAGYELGIRRSDLHNLRADQVRGNRVYIVQNKTGVPVGKQVSEECASLLHQLIDRGDGKTVFRWAIGTKWLGVHFTRLVKAAGLRGSIKYLRRSGATHCEIARPGSAGRFLGQLTPGLAYRFYVDPALASGDMPTPPLIGRKG